MAKGMNDLGYTYPKNDCQPITAGSGKKEKHYPTVYIDHKVPKDLMNADIGDELMITAKVKVTSKSINDNSSGSKEEVRIDLLEMSVDDSSKLGTEVKRQLKK